jgi:hypothetical protein
MNVQLRNNFHLIKSIFMENHAVTELTLNEMIAVEGGQPLSYYLGFAIGAVAGTAVSFVSGLVGGLEGHHI